MAAQHIKIAQENGPKAGFKAYIASLERSGLPQVQDKLAEIRSHGNAKAQFEFYCSTFGKFFGATPVKTDEIDELRSLVEQAQARLAELQGEGVGVVVEPRSQALDYVLRRTSRTTTKTKATDAKVNLWRPWAVKKYGIPQKVGATFTYKSKKARKNTTHEVVRITDEGTYCKRVA